MTERKCASSKMKWPFLPEKHLPRARCCEKKIKSGLRKLKNAVKFDDFVLKFKKHAGKGKLKNTVILIA